MSEPTNQTPKMDPRVEQAVEDARMFFHHLLTKNLGFKLLSVLLALCLWVFLITQDPNLTRETTFNDVSVSVVNSEVLKRNGFIVVSDMEELLSTTMRVNVPQGNYANAQASNYNVRVDLSRIKQPGAQELRILANSTSTNGSVIDLNPSAISVVVEKYVNRNRIPVIAQTSGELPEGYAIGSTVLDATVISISGPESIVNSVVRAQVMIDLEQVPAEENVVVTAFPFQLIDRQGKVVESKLVEVYSDGLSINSVNVQHTVVSKRTINLSELNLITGKPADGYQVLGVTVTPSEVTACGKLEDLEALESLFLSQPVSVDRLTEPLVQVMKVRKPTELTQLKPDSVTLLVDIGPVIESRTFESLPVSVTNVSAELTASLRQATASVTVTGPKLVLEQIRAGQLHISCDAAGCGEGIHELALACTVDQLAPDACSIEIYPQKVQLELTAR